MKVLVTGNLGYIGPYLVKQLREEGHYVVGCDVGLFSESQMDYIVPPHFQISKDFRALNLDDLRNIDCIIHLAGISNDPMGSYDPALTFDINYTGSTNLAHIAKHAGVSRFLFSSSCSIYGKSGERPLTESDLLSPTTPYNTSKISLEKYLDKLADENFTTAYLRNSTSFGFSPVYRIDLVVNNLLASALTKGKIKIMSNGESWRPFLHCSDIAKAFIPFVSCPGEMINKQAVNIGANDQNFQVKEVALIVKELVPDAAIEYTGEVGEDPRDYKVCFDKLYRLFPEYCPDYTLRTGMEELLGKLKAYNFSESDFDSDRFTRLKLLKKNISLLKL